MDGAEDTAPVPTPAPTAAPEPTPLAATTEPAVAAEGAETAQEASAPLAPSPVDVSAAPAPVLPPPAPQTAPAPAKPKPKPLPVPSAAAAIEWRQSNGPDVIEWRLERLKQALGFSELAQRSGSPPRAMESPWFSTRHGRVRFRVHLVHEGAYGAVEIEHTPFEPTAKLPNGSPRKWAFVPADPAAASVAVAFELEVGNVRIGSEGLGNEWGPFFPFRSREALLASGDGGPGGGALALRLRIDHPLGEVFEGRGCSVWAVPVGSSFVRRARPGDRIRSRPLLVGGAATQACLILKREKHPGFGRVLFRPAPTVPVVVRIGDVVRRSAPYDFEDLADLVGETNFEVIVNYRPREQQGFLEPLEDGYGIKWVAGLDNLAKGEWIWSKSFEYLGGEAHFVCFPGGNEATQCRGEGSQLDDDGGANALCSVYVQITGGRGGRWHLECGDTYNGGVIDPCEAATSIGLENVPRSDTLIVILS